MSHTQDGIKWWKVCPVCTWAAKTQGAVGDLENALDQCPNCNNPKLEVAIDDHVFHGLRYDARVRNTKGQTIADEVRQNTGRPPAPPDANDNSNRGFQYDDPDDTPYDEDGNPRPPPPARVIEVGEEVDPSVSVVITPGNGG